MADMHLPGDGRRSMATSMLVAAAAMMGASACGMVAVGIRDFLILSGIGVMLLLAKSGFTRVHVKEDGEDQ